MQFTLITFCVHLQEIMKNAAEKQKGAKWNKMEKFWGRNEQNQNFKDLTAPATV